MAGRLVEVLDGSLTLVPLTGRVVAARQHRLQQVLAVRVVPTQTHAHIHIMYESNGEENIE